LLDSVIEGALPVCTLVLLLVPSPPVPQHVFTLLAAVGVEVGRGVALGVNEKLPPLPSQEAATTLADLLRRGGGPPDRGGGRKEQAWQQDRKRIGAHSYLFIRI
jgi:hypothetical protein